MQPEKKKKPRRVELADPQTADRGPQTTATAEGDAKTLMNEVHPT
jgi:hypothetical protein